MAIADGLSGGAREGDRPSRSQAGESVSQLGRTDQDPRLRDRALGDAVGSDRRDASAAIRRPVDRTRDGARHDRLHVARAGARPGGGSPFRSVLARSDAVRDVVGTTGVHGPVAGRYDERHPEGRSGAAACGPRDPREPRRPRCALPAKVTGRSLSRRLEISAPHCNRCSTRTRARRRQPCRAPGGGASLYAAAAVALILASLAAWSWQRASSARVARQELLPEIERLAADIPWTGEGPNGWTAYALAIKAERSIPGDPMLNRLWEAISSPVDIRTGPAGGASPGQAVWAARRRMDIVRSHAARRASISERVLTHPAGARWA